MPISNLYDYYTGKGQALPSLEERGKLYESQGLGTAVDYITKNKAGDIGPNTALLAKLTAIPGASIPENGVTQPVSSLFPPSNAGIVTTSDSIRNAEQLKLQEDNKKAIEQEKERQNLIREADITKLKAEIAGGVTKPATPGLVETYKGLRTEQDVSSLETRLTDLGKQKADLVGQFNKWKKSEAVGFTQAFATGRISEEARNAQDQIDAITREENVVTDKLKLKNDYINNVMTLTGKDYENATAEYNGEFSKNLQVQNLYNSKANESQKDANAYLTSVSTLIGNSGKNWGSIPDSMKVAIGKAELKAGWVPGTLEQFARIKPKSNLLGTVNGYDAAGNGLISFIYSDENGNPGVIQTVGTGLKSTTVGVGKPSTEAEKTVAGYAARMEQAEPDIQTTEKDIAEMNVVSFNAQINLPATFQSSVVQQYMQAARNFINANLRKESGAAIAESEFVNARQQYLPQPGDSEAVLKQKKANRDLQFASFKKSAGTAFSSVNELLGNKETPAPTGSTYKSASGNEYKLPF